MLASVKASRYSANPKGLALTPIQTKDAGGCGASQRELARTACQTFACFAPREAQIKRWADAKRVPTR